jgi:hypothetical protein
MAEAISALLAVLFAKEMGFTDVFFEGDDLQVIQALSTTPPHLHWFGHFVESILLELQYFKSFSFAHCRRDANGVAHSLAKAVASQCLEARWIVQPPSFICN